MGVGISPVCKCNKSSPTWFLLPLFSVQVTDKLCMTKESLENFSKNNWRSRLKSHIFFYNFFFLCEILQTFSTFCCLRVLIFHDFVERKRNSLIVKSPQFCCAQQRIKWKVSQFFIACIVEARQVKENALLSFNSVLLAYFEKMWMPCLLCHLSRLI